MFRATCETLIQVLILFFFPYQCVPLRSDAYENKTNSVKINIEFLLHKFGCFFCKHAVKAAEIRK